MDERLQTAEVAESRPVSRRTQRQSLRIDSLEWKLVQRDAGEHGMKASVFVVMLWRNWRAKRWPLEMLPPLPRDPWVGKKEVDSEVKR